MYEEGTAATQPSPARLATLQKAQAGRSPTKVAPEYPAAAGPETYPKIPELAPEHGNAPSVHSIHREGLNTDSSPLRTKGSKALSSQFNSLANNPDYSFQSINLVNPLNLRAINQSQDRYRTSDY